MKRAGFALYSICLSAIFSVAGPVAAATTYRVTALEGPPGQTLPVTRAVAIGPTGLVAGDVNGASQAALWNDAGRFLDRISVDFSSTYTSAFAINSSGQALMEFDGTALWSQGTITPLSFGNTWARTFAINDAGQIVGSLVVVPVQVQADGTVVPGVDHAFVWSNGVTTDLGTLPGGGNSVATHINNNGQAAGYAFTSGGATHAVLWSNGSIVDLGTLPGDTDSDTRNINDAGEVVGFSHSGTRWRPFRWSNGVMTELAGGYDSNSFSGSTMNNAGQIVGSITITGVQHAAVWSNGVVTDLSPALGRDSCYGAGINDAGQIIVNCRHSIFYTQAFKLMPIGAGVDLAVQQNATPNPVALGNTLTYNLTVTNGGSLPATGVSLMDGLPAGVSYISAVASQGSCAGSTTVVCALGDLASGASASVRIDVTPVGAGTLANSATVTANEADVNAANDSASTSVVVNAPLTTADLSVTLSDSPDPVKRRTNLTYAITIRNSGPGSASGVTLKDTLSSNLSFVSAASSQGSCSGTSTVTCNLGSIASGANASVTIVVRPRTAGTYTNNASVSTSTTDSNTANNGVSATTTVK